MITFKTEEKTLNDFYDNYEEVEALIEKMLLNDDKKAKVVSDNFESIVTLDDLTSDWDTLSWLEFAQLEFAPEQVDKNANKINVSTCDVDESYDIIDKEYEVEELIDMLIESGKNGWVVEMYKPIGWCDRYDEPIEQDCGEFEIDYDEYLSKDDLIEYIKKRLKEQNNENTKN